MVHNSSNFSLRIQNINGHMDTDVGINIVFEMRRSAGTPAVWDGVLPRRVLGGAQIRWEFEPSFGAFTSSADLSALAALPSGVVEAFWASVFVNLGAWPTTYLAALGVQTPTFLSELSERTIQTALTASLAGLTVHRELALVGLVSRRRDGPLQ